MPSIRPTRFCFPSRAVTAFLMASLLVGTAFAHGDDDEGDDGNSYAIGLWGALPYNDIQAQVGVPNLIADMNSQKLKFTVHDGALKGGQRRCRLGNADDLLERAVCAVAGLFEFIERTGNVHAWRQRLDRL
jgi:hypothetical protein